MLAAKKPIRSATAVLICRISEYNAARKNEYSS